MAKRKIIEIDRDKCDGCGLCTTACAEGALELDAENKAVLVRELYCDGLGACLDVCPAGALRVVEREGEAYDPGAAFKHVLKTRGEEAAAKVHGQEPAHGHDLEQTQWPIQLHLVSPLAPYFQGADLLVAADCTAFALGSFHQDLLAGKKLVIACPKLDETDGYAAKLAEIIRLGGLNSLTVAIMSVPCCGGLYQLARRAVEASGVDLPVLKVVIHIDGRVL
jgi:NAD-dependent dihydropyrimidine dehydrogenase PreA subunit